MILPDQSQKLDTSSIISPYFRLPRLTGCLHFSEGFMDLRGQVCLVTGGGRGLGRAYALALAKAQAQVVVTARTEAEIQATVRAILELGGSAAAFPADATDRPAVERLVASVEHQFGRVDLLVNNAGAFCALGAVAEVDPDGWWEEVTVNLRGPLLFTHAVLPGMIARQHGRIINLASNAGLRSLPTVSAYGVSKTALIRLTESVAIENEARHIAAFAIDPGTVRTSLSEYVSTAAEIGQRAPMVQGWFQELFAAGEDTPVERSVALVLRLASGEADALSGCFLIVEDDLDALIAQAEAIQEDDRLKLRLREL
jgi:NAD(P)-dependent dehydrogenase (short-subunit alcohol dehydrogenase family)